MFCNDMNQLRGEIKELSTGNVLYEITGSWMNKLYITDKKVSA
jgi:molybdopterin-binding protein